MIWVCRLLLPLVFTAPPHTQASLFPSTICRTSPRCVVVAQCDATVGLSATTRATRLENAPSLSESSGTSTRETSPRLRHQEECGNQPLRESTSTASSRL